MGGTPTENVGFLTFNIIRSSLLLPSFHAGQDGENGVVGKEGPTIALEEEE